MASSRVQALVAQHSMMVFAKSYCPHCRATRELLDQLGATYTALNIDLEDDGSQLQDALEAMSGQRTVPNIYIGGQHIGGNSDLQQLAKSDALKTLLTGVGALKL